MIQHCSLSLVLRSFVLAFAILLLMPLVLNSVAVAQSATATLSGSVVDQNDAVVPGARVKAINLGTGLEREAVTNDSGNFTIQLLPPSTYTVRVERDGFATVEISNVILNVNDQKALQIQLKAGNISEMVKIESDAPLLDESPAVSTVVDRQFVENMPLNGRSFQSLITLSPGVVLNKTTFNEQGQFSVNGQRADANYFTVDGVSANAGISAGFSLVQSAGGALPAFGANGGTNSLVSVDALQEFKIHTSTFAPEFGRTPGAQIQILTRSGTNDFHGTAFEYFRNDALDANDWFANSLRLPKPALRQNDFGGVFGGPLYLPRFGEGGPSFSSGKNRTFFFFSYEALRLRLPQTLLALVPSTAVRQTAVPQMRPFLNAFPVPNGQTFANGLAQFNASFSNPLTLDATSIRIDHSLGSKVTVFGRYNYSPSNSTERAAAGTGSTVNTIFESDFKTQTLTVGSTQILTSSTSNEILANFTKTEGGSTLRLDDFGGAVPPPDSLLYPSPHSAQDALFTFQISGGGSIWSGKNVKNSQRQFNLVNNLTVLAGLHQLKFGADYRLLLPTGGPRSYSQFVSFSVTGASAGTVDQFAQIAAFETVPLKVTNFSLYGQDTWKATPRLTLTYGLRWEVNPAPKGRDGKDLLTIDNLNNPAAGLVWAPPGTPLYETTWGNFAPRIGAAYQLSSRSGRETMLRGGFGVFYDLGIGSIGNAAIGIPYTRSKVLAGVPYPLTTAQLEPPPINLSAPASGNAHITSRDLKLPRTYQWNLAVEQSLGPNQTVSATYVGAAGRDLLRIKALRPVAGLTVNVTENTATSDYHAMQLQFQRRLSKGLQALASYTWAHSIDIASNDSVSGGTPADPKIDRGNSDFDVRHAFNAAVTYDIPSLQSDGFWKAILDDWSIDSIITARSRTPVNLIARTDFTGGFQTSVRPNLIPGVPLYIDDPNAPGGRRFNDAAPTAAQVAAAGCVAQTATNAKGAWCTPPAGLQGTFGRNVLRGFPAFQVDMALRRQFSLTERFKLQFRAEAFNIFNHPNFGDQGLDANFNSTNSLTSPLFGRSTQMLGRSLGTGGASGGFNPLYQIGGPRSMQFALRLTF